MNDKFVDEFLKYQKVIASLLRKMRPNTSSQDVEDILQETFINTYQASLKKEIHFPKAFMVKTAIRLANRHSIVSGRTVYDEDIEQKSNETVSQADLSQMSQTENAVLKKEDFGFLCSAINSLPTKCRKVFILKKVYGLSQREISKRLGISESTVEKHVAKGLLKATQVYDLLHSDTDNTDNVVDVFLGKKQHNSNEKS